MKTVNENCNDCKHINMTEEEQKDNSKCHICLKHNVRVIHGCKKGNYIYPCLKCNGNDFEEREAV